MFQVEGLTGKRVTSNFQPPAKELGHLISVHGGIVDYNKTTRTNFEIAEILPRAKRRKLLEHHRIVHTSFIIDSITQKKLANWREYRHFEDTYLSRKKKIRHYLTRPR